MTLKLTLKQARVLKEKTQLEVANYLGIHVQTYRKLEENMERTTVAQARKICEFLGCSYDDIKFF